MKSKGGEENGKSSETQNQEALPALSWFDKNWEPVDEDRIKGMIRFKTIIEKSRTEMDNCKDRGYARRMFAKWGDFYLEENAPANEKYRGIPKTTVFRVYEPQEKRAERDQEVVLVVRCLDTPSTINEGLDADVYPVWRCTYIPYREIKQQQSPSKPEGE